MPYEALFYNGPTFKEYRKTLSGESEIQQLDLLLEFMDTNLEKINQEYERNVPHGKVTGAIAWTLFPPEEVIRLMNGVLNVSCSRFEWNGTSFGNVSKTIAFKPPVVPGSFPITSLSAFPLRYHPQYEKLKTRLIARCHRYTKIVKRSHMCYNGTALTRDPLDLEVASVHLNERVMIDYAEFVRQDPEIAPQLETDPGVDIAEDVEYEKCWCSNPDCKVAGRKKSPTEDARSTGENAPSEKVQDPEHDAAITITDDEAFLCPGNIKWNQEAYSRLEMNDEYKHVIRALVEAHRKHPKPDSEEFDDIIAGKGLGLVFQLQGDPGLGKTLTAESVAEQASKPLYAVTSGELGTTVNTMESALKKAFRIAKTWDAILLLDEADVFLSKRSADNLEKNALVSVFLRLMECYQGIMFPTTNRAEDFDPAFMSRIHLTLDYRPLTPERRVKIWRNLSAKMAKDETLDEGGLQQLATDYDINGREIKNLLRTAWCLAKDNRRPLTMADIRAVARISSRYSGTSRV
ncbi:hypothetical protein TI39_contig5830g00010 [Zymoseptoria brevis]|uniref:AAA+ ATPase domain-containing protein n=1 Tax=Zymoseptoria brevis TaxID=1047168 RepID=A0A0F4G900_9PEZI|nr:hypothetical protein TI39_contig5830g00010 [Zymoseptoria brevis]